mgnify:FL=1
MISDNLTKKVNEQIKEELESAYLYLAMSAYCESKNFSGFAHWLKEQAKEEQGHALKLYGHLLERGGLVELKAISAPPKEFGSPRELFEQVLVHEQKITALIRTLYEVAKEEKDYPLEMFLQWFINEQVEEEASATKIVETLKMIDNKAQGLIMLDRELARR